MALDPDSHKFSMAHHINLASRLNQIKTRYITAFFLLAKRQQVEVTTTGEQRLVGESLEDGNFTATEGKQLSHLASMATEVLLFKLHKIAWRVLKTTLAAKN